MSKIAGAAQTADATLKDRQLMWITGANVGAVCFVETYDNTAEDVGTFTWTEIQTVIAPAVNDRAVVI